MVRTSLKITTGANAVVIQRDGKLVAVGCDANTTQGGAHDLFEVVRYNENGSLDRSFGSGGKVANGIGPDNACAHALGIQRDGKLVAAGVSGGYPQRFTLARYVP